MHPGCAYCHCTILEPARGQVQGGTDSNRAPVGVAGVEPAPSPYGVCQPRHSTPERGQAGISRLPSRGPGSRQGSYRVWGPDTVLLLNYLLPRLFKAKQSRPPPAPAPERRLAPCRYLHLMCPAGCSSQRCTPMPCRLPGNRGGGAPQGMQTVVRSTIAAPF